jgi:hypothetical protein
MTVSALPRRLGCGYYAGMTKAPSRGRPSRKHARAARLAAALKANLQRRKIQARSRAGEPAEAGAEHSTREFDGPREPDRPGHPRHRAGVPHIGAAIVEDKRTG